MGSGVGPSTTFPSEFCTGSACLNETNASFYPTAHGLTGCNECPVRPRSMAGEKTSHSAHRRSLASFRTCANLSGNSRERVTPAALAATTSASGEEISISECLASFQFERTIVGDRGFHVCRFDVWNRNFRAPFDRSDHRAASAGLVDLFGVEA